MKTYRPVNYVTKTELFDLIAEHHRTGVVPERLWLAIRLIACGWAKRIKRQYHPDYEDEVSACVLVMVRRLDRVQPNPGAFCYLTQQAKWYWWGVARANKSLGRNQAIYGRYLAADGRMPETWERY